jgi:hypothetical protein
LEEMDESTAALGNEADSRYIAEEAANVLVTLVGASFAAGPTFEELTPGHLHDDRQDRRP